jgi:hypothetical protein
MEATEEEIQESFGDDLDEANPGAEDEGTFS